MADKTLTDRLQPSLLDRLTDNAPDRVQETMDERVIDLRRLREIIQRDLSALLNTSNHDDIIDKEKYPYTFTSVVNYGIGEVAGSYSSMERAILIRAMIQRAIQTFEPRIVSSSLDVRLRKDEKGTETLVTFDIAADMWAQPLPMELYLRSQVDLGTGELKLERVS